MTDAEANVLQAQLRAILAALAEHTQRLERIEQRLTDDLVQLRQRIALIELKTNG